MINIDRLARHIAKNGPDGILIHTIPKTNNWIICQKMELDKWLLTLCNPMGNVTFNLGTVNNAQHIQLWEEIIRMEIENKVSQMATAKELRNKINNFKKRYEQNYKKFLKGQEKKAKQKRSQCCKRNKRFKKSFV